MKTRQKIMALLFSAAVASSVSAGPLFPNKDLSFVFDGFCDGMSLHIDTTKGTAVGTRTGCIATQVAGIIGMAAGSTYHGGITLGLSDGAGGYLTMFIGDNKKWSILQPDGVVFQSGTWSIPVPTVMSNPNAPAVGRR